MEMAGLEKTWAGRVSLGMKVVIIEVSVVVEMVVDGSDRVDFYESSASNTL